MRLLHTLLVLATAPLFACGTTDVTPRSQDCGAGTPVKADGELYCVYRQAIVIEDGFTCPAFVPHLSVRAPIGACKDSTDPITDPQFDRIDDVMRPKQPELYENTCDSSSACTNDQVCNARTCVPTVTCVVDAECDTGQICDQGTCRQGTNDICTPAPETCDRVDNDCDGLTDEDDVCAQAPCTDNAQCAAGEQCEDGICVMPNNCQTDADCSPDQACVLGMCAAPPECTSDGMCDAEQYCNATLQCEDLPNRCVSDSMCPASFSCTQERKCAARPERCVQDADCTQPQETCVDQLCTVP